MPDPNLPLLEDAVQKLAPFLDEIVFVGSITLGILITDKAASPIRGTNDVESGLIKCHDDEAPWTEGSVSLGGGWLPVEFRSVTVSA